MIAFPLPAPQPASQPRPRVRTARRATELRRRKTRRMRYQQAARIISTLTVATLCILGYLMLLGNVTRLHYELGKAQHRQAALSEATLRLDDDIAQLESRERLAAIAARLGMHDPHLYAMVTVPRAPVVAHRPPSGLAFLAEWLRP